MTGATDARQEAKRLAIGFADRAAHWDSTRTYCFENVTALTEAGLMGMTTPRAYGGQGASLLETVGVIEEIARACTLTARIVVEANMGAVGAIIAYGSEAQRALAASYVLAGDKPAILITEPDAGSAATEMTTTARRTAGCYVIDGTKHWITGGGVSKLHLVFAQIVEGGRPCGIGAFLIVRDPARGLTPDGFNIIGRENTMGLRGMPEATIALNGVRVDEGALLREPNGAPVGFGPLMAAYNAQRVGAAATAMGIAAGAVERAQRYLLDRHQFGRPLAEFQGLQWMLADMDTAVSASRLLIKDAATSLDENGFPDPLKAARAKLFASESAIRVVNDAQQMFGARGYSDREPLERMARDVRMFTIGGGTAQILRNQIASRLLGIKTPQTRDGYAQESTALAAE